MTEKKVAVVLSGCGVFDGAEIHESVTGKTHRSAVYITGSDRQSTGWCQGHDRTG